MNKELSKENLEKFYAYAMTGKDVPCSNDKATCDSVKISSSDNKFAEEEICITIRKGDADSKSLVIIRECNATKILGTTSFNSNVTNFDFVENSKLKFTHNDISVVIENR